MWQTCFSLMYSNFFVLTTQDSLSRYWNFYAKENYLNDHQMWKANIETLYVPLLGMIHVEDNEILSFKANGGLPINS